MVRQGEVGGSIGWTKIKVAAGGRRIVAVVGHHRRRRGNGLTNSSAGCGRSQARRWWHGLEGWLAPTVEEVGGSTWSMNKKAEAGGEEEEEQ